VLSRGIRIWGIASDDEHELAESVKGDPQDPGRGALPGRGWIMVRAPHLTTGDIMDAIDKGDFYASTGVYLKDYRVDGTQVTLSVITNNQFRTEYYIEFVGKNGRVLQESTGSSARYTVRGDELYIRTRITDSNGRKAWSQPVFLQ
jgi:hypothetical protein